MKIIMKLMLTFFVLFTSAQIIAIPPAVSAPAIAGFPPPVVTQGIHRIRSLATTRLPECLKSASLARAQTWNCSTIWDNYAIHLAENGWYTICRVYKPKQNTFTCLVPANVNTRFIPTVKEETTTVAPVGHWFLANGIIQTREVNASGSDGINYGVWQHDDPTGTRNITIGPYARTNDQFWNYELSPLYQNK